MRIFDIKKFCEKCTYSDEDINSTYIYINISMLTIASIWCKNMYAYLSANINCSKMQTVFQEGSLRKNHELVVEVRFENCEPIVDIRFENWGVSLG